MNLNLTLFGDNIIDGNYYFHSKFVNVTNFTNENNNLLSIVKNENYFSSNSLMFENFETLDCKNIFICKNFIIINNQKISLETKNKYNSIFNFPKCELDFINHKINFLISLIKYLPPKSLLFLHNKELEQNFTTLFEKELVKIIKIGYNQIKEKNYLEGIKNIKARGSGLTPAGDDFVAGFLVAKNLKNKCFAEDNSILCQNIFEISKSQNIFSNTFIEHAFKSFYFAKLKMFLKTFFANKETDFENATINLCKTGNSSGADLLSGFLAGLINYGS